MKKFEEIKKVEDLAKALNITINKLYYFSNNSNKPNKLYTQFTITKKLGGERTINAPKKELKKALNKLFIILKNRHLNYTKEKKIKDKISFGFKKNNGIIDNAKNHRNKKYVLNVDIKNFFDSFHFGRICGFFMKSKEFKINSKNNDTVKKISILISNLLCYKQCLPQGSPCSPILSNLIFRTIDYEILKLSKKYKLKYTRYADDMTFSTNDNNFLNSYENFISELNECINKNGFKINDKKTQIEFYKSRQRVTGLVVNQKLSVRREFYKNTKSMALNFYRNGYFKINDKIGKLNQLEGRFSFINQIDKFNNIESNKYENKNKDFYYVLNSREKQYKLFLFYKFFYNPSKPIIITEGKTDILYIKAALKKFYEKYPNIIQKNLNGTFSYKVKFLAKENKQFSNYKERLDKNFQQIEIILKDVIENIDDKKLEDIIQYVIDSIEKIKEIFKSKIVANKTSFEKIKLKLNYFWEEIVNKKTSKELNEIWNEIINIYKNIKITNLKKVNKFLYFFKYWFFRGF
ncbi:reverse transcriptase domain-containing protein [Metamycoplasma phocicerebrale]|nr:reverse transcriptase domain-containing protein [Metamycoplasma phocicerebrale]